MSKININICYRDVEEPMEFENMSSLEIIKDSKFLYLATDIDVEYYIPMENVLYFEIDYKKKKK